MRVCRPNLLQRNRLLLPERLKLGSGLGRGGTLKPDGATQDNIATFAMRARMGLFYFKS